MNDDSYVIVRHLLRYASRFDASQPVCSSAMLSTRRKVFGPNTRTFGGTCGMLLSRATLYNARTLRGCPGRGGDAAFVVPNDQHIVHWARRIGVRLLCTPTRSRYLLSASALPADSDARLLAHVGYCNLNAYV